MHIDWDEVRLFLAVAESGSLSAAARSLRTTQPTVSRRLADLEARLGEPLFARGAEGATLTSFAEHLLEPAKQMAEWATVVERTAESVDAEPRGVVRVTAPPGVAADVLAPAAAALRSELPGIRLEVISTVSYLDLSRREADLALRTQVATQRDLVTVASIHFDAVPFASREYAAKLPRRAKLADVDWIGWAPPLDHLSPNPELGRLIPGFRPVFASDDFLVQLSAAEAGLGAIFLGRVRHRFSRETRLVELHVDLPAVPSSMHLVAAKSALAIPRVGAVADWLSRELARADTSRRPRKRG
ncbi:MAG: LysR family transcriptional regulator [Myxococcales bacterium]|nr:LysR family transcriptional regulator [Myxococcales bacterium]